MVGVPQRQESRAALDSQIDPVLERDLERLLDRHRAVGRKEEVGGLDWDHVGERLRQLDDHCVAVAEHRRVSDLGGLGREGGVQLGDVVTERVHPQRRDGIEVASSVGVDELTFLGALYHQRRVVSVGPHLGEPVPDHGRVALDPGPRNGPAHSPILDAGRWAGPFRENRTSDLLRVVDRMFASTTSVPNSSILTRCQKHRGSRVYRRHFSPMYEAHSSRESL